MEKSMTKTTEFIRTTLIAHEEAQRQTGRTSRIVQKAIANNLVMVCHTGSFARELERGYGSFGLKAIGINTYLSEDYNRGKPRRKHVFDHLVEYTMIIKKLDEVEGALDDRTGRI
jgi:hypothetical protein